MDETRRKVRELNELVVSALVARGVNARGGGGGGADARAGDARFDVDGGEGRGVRNVREGYRARDSRRRRA